MTGATQLVTVSNGQYTFLVTLTDCRQVRVAEDRSVSGWPTTDYFVAKPGSGNTPRRIGGGSEYVFDGPFTAGTVVGLLKTVTGSTSFYQDES